MTKTSIDPPFLKAARPQIDAALKELGDKLGVTLQAGNASCDRAGDSGHYKLEVLALQPDGNVLDQDAISFKRYAKILGFEESDLGKTVTLAGGRSFTIAGYRPKARKNNIVIRDASGKTFVAALDVVLAKLKKG